MGTDGGAVLMSLNLATNVQRQTREGACTALRPSTPAVVYDKVQDWPATDRAGLTGADAPNSLTNWRGLNCAPSFSPNSHPAILLPAGGRVHLFRTILPVEQGIRPSHNAERFQAARVRLSARCAGCSRRSTQSLPAQQFLQGIAHRLHSTHRLSSSLVLVGIDPNEIGLTHAQAFFAPGAKAND